MKEICAAELCCGCEACANRCPKQCISFVFDAEGFFVPKIDEIKCIDCGLCQKVCPALSPETHKKDEPEVYAAYALDDSIRCTSSSGGLYSVFANAILDDGGVINGTAFDKDFICWHELTDQKNDTARFRGSKYVQSRIGMVFKDIETHLKNGRKVFFSGVPCQVSALYHFLGKDYENLYTCDIICHGVPAPKFLQDYVSDVSRKMNINTPSGLTFRELKFWGYSPKFQLPEGETAINKENNYYLNAFLPGKNYRMSCYACPYATKSRVGDITIGDFWGLGLYKKFKGNTKKGVSAVLINSEKGRLLLNSVKSQIYLEKRTWNEAARENHQLRQPTKKYPLRESFYRDYAEMPGKEFIKKHCNIKNRSLFHRLLSFPYRAARKAIRILIRQINFILNA